MGGKVKQSQCHRQENVDKFKAIEQQCKSPISFSCLGLAEKINDVCARQIRDIMS